MRTLGLEVEASSLSLSRRWANGHVLGSVIWTGKFENSSGRRGSAQQLVRAMGRLSCERCLRGAYSKGKINEKPRRICCRRSGTPREAFRLGQVPHPKPTTDTVPPLPRVSIDRDRKTLVTVTDETRETRDERRERRRTGETGRAIGIRKGEGGWT